MRATTITLTLLAVLVTVLHAQTPDLNWAHSFGSPGFERGIRVTTDDSGYVYTTGTFSDTTDFDPSGATFNLVSNGFNDLFIQKLDTAGNLIWAKSMGGPIIDHGNCIVVDDSGNVYVTGYFGDTADFDPGPGTHNLISSGFDDIFILKLDPNGSLLWAHAFGGQGLDRGQSLTVDGAGDIYIVGDFSDTTDFDPGAGVFNLIASNNSDLFILKLDPTGSFIRAISFGISNAASRSIIVDSVDFVYISGGFNGTMDFDPGPATHMVASTGNLDAFMLKLNPSGDFISVLTYGGNTSCSAQASAFDGSGNRYITGSYTGTVDFNPGGATFNATSIDAWDIYLLKLDPNGNFIWVRTMGGPFDDLPWDVCTDPFGNVYMTGQYRVSIDLDPGPDTLSFTSIGGEEGFYLKLYSAGDFMWGYPISGTAQELGKSITSDGSGNIYVTGGFSSIVDFDPSGATFDLTTNGSGDMFLLKLSQCFPITVTDVQSACTTFTWLDGNTYTSSSDTNTYTISGGAVNGCDSIVTLDLTILTTSYGADVQNACGSLTWLDGNTYTSSNTTATYTLSNAAGCDSIVTLNLTINVPDISVTVNDPSITANETGAFYQWLDCNNSFALIPGESGQNFSPTTNGDYAVEVTINGCTDTSTCITLSNVSTSIKANILFEDVTISPNPTLGLLQLNFGKLSEISIKVLTIGGRLIYMQENINTSTYQMNLEELPGVYVLEISSQGEMKRYQFIKY
ncbi:MAG: T9SS type A sorting domain-containing protein [Flavobacteriales bacterium]|nr:T9SS type A sorting domain-containing protein [Flavobacteriales bacterium]